LVIGEGIQIKGEIEACDILIVEGTVEASLQARCLEIRPGGRFIGEAVVVEAKIEGSFEGKLKVSETLSLSRHGRVKGRTRYGGLQVEKGGQLSGDIDLRPVELSLA
jgi:cytoskeletal protein CcmA (bactofilin family)